MTKASGDMKGFVPGMDFLQSLLKAAPSLAQTLPPSLSQWIAPTLSVEEIEKKITDLKAVQAWIETNNTMLKTTIQALEVQKMTLSTLKSLKINIAELPDYARGAAKEAVGEIKEKPLDPMQWWGAVSKQIAQPFAQLDVPGKAKRATKSVAKTAASAAASGAAGAAVDAAFGLADKSFKAAGDMAKNALGGAFEVTMPSKAKPLGAAKSKLGAKPKKPSLATTAHKRTKASGR